MVGDVWVVTGNSWGVLTKVLCVEVDDILGKLAMVYVYSEKVYDMKKWRTKNHFIDGVCLCHV